MIIITDGNCHDMEVTKSLMVDMSHMPFSCVVVGVGDSNFEDMEVLDADADTLKDKDDREAVRDIVQLVKYTDFKDLGMRELALEVLGEVPDQFVDYMTMMEQSPEVLFGGNEEVDKALNFEDAGDNKIDEAPNEEESSPRHPKKAQHSDGDEED